MSDPTTEPTVTYAEHGAVALVTLNRPAALNSFTRQMHADLWAALDRAEANPAVRALVVTGAGRGFCAGADLTEFDFEPGPDLVQRADPGPVIEQAFNPTARRMQALRMPTLAAVNGVAAGAGANIALCCDVVVAAQSASFIQAFSKIGLIPDSGGTYFLPRLVGWQKASALAMLGEKIAAEEAERMGMIYKVFANELFDEESRKIAFTLANMPTEGLALTKQLLNMSFHSTFEEQLQEEDVFQQRAAMTYDYNEGINAFLEKRQPAFKGK